MGGRKMGKYDKRARITLGITAALLFGMSLWAWANRPPERIKVKTGNASVQDIYNSVTAPGSVEAVNSTAVCTAETATVAEVFALEGDRVKQGDVLCTLSSAKTEPVDASSLQSLLREISQKPERRVTSDNPAIITAPCAGEILMIPSEGDTVLAGLPCVRIADLSQLQVRVKTPELYAGEVKAGQPANVSASATGDKRYAAEVASVSPMAVRAVSFTGDSGSATVEAVLPLSGDVSGLRPGYTASAKIFTQYHKDAVIVPLEAVCQRGEKEYVFCVENSRAALREVETGYLLENVTEIKRGLNGGETVILSPPDTLMDGALIEPVEVAK